MVDSTNFESKTGTSFKPDSYTVIFREGQMVLDFRKTAPRIDKTGENRIQTVVSEHNPVVMRPEQAKYFKNLLEKNIKKYEEKHGEIELEALEEESSEEEQEQDYIA